jgi:hypothetical protein
MFPKMKTVFAFSDKENIVSLMRCLLKALGGVYVAITL